MNIAVSDAKAQLTELVRRAENGEEVLLTRHGQPVARITPVQKRKPTAEQKRAAMEQIRESARRNIVPGPTTREIDDEMYDEYGLPK